MQNSTDEGQSIRYITEKPRTSAAGGPQAMSSHSQVGEVYTRTDYQGPVVR